ncbi:retrovirus-related pol polyprotein from transposon TNT 1-94, partial [Tanacetum coccineum]
MQTNIKSFTSNQISCTTRYKGKEIAKPITPLSESASEEDSDPEQAQKDKDMQKNLALIAKYFKKLYKPTNNNLRTSSNTRNKNVDTNPRYKTNNQTGQFGNQRAVNVVGARETCSGPECRKPKRVRDSTYHKEKMLLCKQAEKGVQLQAEQSDWLADTDEEIDEQEFGSTLQLHGKDSNSIAALANLIANLKLDVDDNKKIQKQLKKANATLTQELTECKSILAETSRTLGESNSIRDSCLVALQNKTDRVCERSHYEGLVKEKTKDDQNDVECDDERVTLANLTANLKLDVDENKKIQKQLKKANATLTQELTECKSILAETSRTLGECDCLAQKLSEQTEIEREQYFEIQDLKAQLQDKNIAISELKKLIEKCKGKSVDTKSIHITSVSRPHLGRNQMKDKVLPNTSQVKFKKTEVEDHPRISRYSYQTKSVTTCNNSLNSKTSNVNVVCAACRKCVFNSNHDACVSKFLNDVNARTKKPHVVLLDVDENKKIQKQLKKANATLTQELTECKSILAETSRTLGESNSIRDSCLVALQNKQTEFERYKAFNDRTVDYDKLEHKLNEALGLLAQKEIDIKEGLKVKAYEISVVKEKHDELVKQSLLTKSHYEGLVKEKTKVITDLKLKEEKDIDKMISMENQLKFLNEIVYKRSQSIQTIHMLAPKCPTFNGRPTFANPMYLKKAQNEIPCLYAIPHDQSDPANRLVLNREETPTLDNESRSKLNKDLVKPFDYTKLNSLYEIFKPPTQHYEIQFAQANEIRKKMWRKSFVKTKPNIFKNIDFLPVSKSISKSRQAYNVMTNNINHLKEFVDQAWVKHSNDRLHLHNPTAQDMEILVKTCLIPLALKTQNDSFAFVHELKQEMHADLKYVESLEDELESDKAEFSNMYDMLLQECVSKDVMCSYLQYSSDLDEITELQFLYLPKVGECDCLAQKLYEQTEFVNLKAQLQDKNIAISELKKLIEKFKGKSVDTNFDKPSVVRQPNAQRTPKPSVLGKPAPFSDSLERKYFAKKKSVSKTNESEGLSKPVTPQNLPQTATQAVRNTNVITPGMYQIANRVAHKTNVSRSQPRSNQMKDKAVPNTSHVKFKKTEIEEHPRISSISNQTKSVTACNDSINSRTSNINVVCATCGKCVFNSIHDACVSMFLNDVNARIKKPTVVPISTRKPKSQANKFIVQLILFIVDSGCTKHMMGNLSLPCNFVEKYVGTVHFGNDQFAPILRYGDLVQGNVTINRVYYVKGLNHNLFSVGQFYDADLEVAFRKSTCFVRDLQGRDLLTGNGETDLYIISLQETTSLTPICLMAKASPTQAWLWHRRLSYLNFDYINLLSKKDVVIGLLKLKYVKDQLCSSCEMSKAKRSSFKPKTVPSSKGRLNLLHMDLCGQMRVASINGKKYILVFVDDYSRYTWTLFLRSKVETPEVLKDFLTMIQRNLQAPVIFVRTDRGIEFLNKTLNAFFKEEEIEHQTSKPRTPEQNGVVERRNRTLVEAARTMLLASKLPLFFWAEA